MRPLQGLKWQSFYRKYTNFRKLLLLILSLILLQIGTLIQLQDYIILELRLVLQKLNLVPKVRLLENNLLPLWYAQWNGNKIQMNRMFKELAQLLRAPFFRFFSILFKEKSE